jgi:hypothetical protein
MSSIPHCFVVPNHFFILLKYVKEPLRLCPVLLKGLSREILISKNNVGGQES